MAARMLVELPDGKQLIFGGRGPGGLSEVGIGEEITKAASSAFKGALGTLGSLVGMLEDSVGRMEHRPDKVEMEFRASLSGECDLWIVSGDGEAEFKVKLAWGKGE
jgi:Trypsin-co-occurring domain 1